ncbi:MAG TPA: SAM-dependent methyltransferase, partial [Micavibrio sp.]
MANGERQEFLRAVTQSLTEGDFVKLSLGHYMGSQEGLKNIHVRKTLIKRDIKLGFTYRYKTRDIVKNYTPEDGLGRIGQALGGEFQTATLFTTGFDIVFEQIKGRKPILQKKEPAHTSPASLDHDRQKNRLIAAPGKFYLQALNIADESGKILKTAQDKYRQINKYV